MDRLNAGSRTAEDLYFWTNFPNFFTVWGEIINIVIEIHSNVGMQKIVYELFPKNTIFVGWREIGIKSPGVYITMPNV